MRRKHRNRDKGSVVPNTPAGCDAVESVCKASRQAIIRNTLARLQGIRGYIRNVIYCLWHQRTRAWWRHLLEHPPQMISARRMVPGKATRFIVRPSNPGKCWPQGRQDWRRVPVSCLVAAKSRLSHDENQTLRQCNEGRPSTLRGGAPRRLRSGEGEHHQHRQHDDQHQNDEQLPLHARLGQHVTDALLGRLQAGGGAVHVLVQLIQYCALQRRPQPPSQPPPA